jgi:hypothetical protein
MHITELFIHIWLYSPRGPWSLFQFLNLHTVGMTPWTGDQPVSRPLPAYRTAHIEYTHKIDIHASNGIRIHDPFVRAGEDGSCLRPRGHCDRQSLLSLIDNVIREEPDIQFSSSQWADFCDVHIPFRRLSTDSKLKKLNYVALVSKQTIPTERPPFVGEVSANFCG